MSFRLFDRWLAIAAMFVLGLGVCATLANAAPYTIDFNDDPGHAKREQLADPVCAGL